MTWGFVASFGGLVLVMAALLLVERLLAPTSDLDDGEDRRQSGELAAALIRAEAAAHQAEREIATARSIAIRS